MKLAKYLFLGLLVMPFAAQLHAQTLVASVAGSSALWLEAGQGAYAALGCVWTDKNTTTNTYTTDVRTGAGSAQDFGKIWVAWTNTGSCTSPTAAAQVYAYISLDSGIGNRCLFAVPKCKLTTIDTSGTAGSGALGSGFPDTALPSGVLSAFNNSSISVAATDILPLDALFATYQALSPCGQLSSGTQYDGYGRGTWPGPGTQIQAQDGSALFNVLGWEITGTDPFTGSAAAGQYTVTSVDAAPVLIFVNTGNATGFGASNVTNIDRATLGLYFTNILVRTQDAVPQTFGGLTNANYAGITAWHRESLAGTYNVFDRAIPNSKELYRTQEQVCPPVEPMNFGRTIADGGTSTSSNNLRAIGTGDEITQVQSTNDSIGYAFWSAGNFKSATYGSGTAGALKYLTVDGVDPLCSTYGCGGSAGEIPTATNTFLSNVNLNNIANGSYGIWSELRFVSVTSAGTTAATTLAGWAQSESTTPGGAQPDFITAPNLLVSRAHFSEAFVTDAYTASQGPRVCGTSSGAIEAGGDAGGIVTSLQAGADYAVLKGNYGTSSCTGITNAASFGFKQ
jgi:hypothetical protein